MKKLSIFMLALAAVCALACNGKDVKYEVSGKNAPEDGAAVYLVDKLTDAPIDSAVIADGAFTMKGKAAKDAFLSVQIDGWQWFFPLFNDGEPLQINLADSTYAGSALNMKLSECDKRDGAAMKEFTDFIQAYLALPKEEQEAREAEFITEYQARAEAYGDSYMSMIEENMDNLIPLAFLSNVPALADKDKFDELMASGAPFTQHPYAIALKAKTDEAYAQEQEAEEGKNAFIGKKFLELEEADPDGKMHKLSEYVGQGKWVLVDFWASWCGPCKAEMPNVVEAYKKYHDKGFEVVGISFDKEKEPWVKAIKEWEMPWIHLSDLKYWNNAAADVYSVNAIPDNLLIDPKGVIVERGLRGEKLKARLAEIFE
jgi:thiol-disulfide isomerase/thioredoxin